MILHYIFCFLEAPIGLINSYENCDFNARCDIKLHDRSVHAKLRLF